MENDDNANDSSNVDYGYEDPDKEEEEVQDDDEQGEGDGEHQKLPSDIADDFYAATLTASEDHTETAKAALESVLKALASQPDLRAIVFSEDDVVSTDSATLPDRIWGIINNPTALDFTADGPAAGDAPYEWGRGLSLIAQCMSELRHQPFEIHAIASEFYHSTAQYVPRKFDDQTVDDDDEDPEGGRIRQHSIIGTTTCLLMCCAALQKCPTTTAATDGDDAESSNSSSLTSRPKRWRSLVFETIRLLQRADDDDAKRLQHIIVPVWIEYIIPCCWHICKQRDLYVLKDDHHDRDRDDSTAKKSSDDKDEEEEEEDVIPLSAQPSKDYTMAFLAGCVGTSAQVARKICLDGKTSLDNANADDDDDGGGDDDDYARSLITTTELLVEGLDLPDDTVWTHPWRSHGWRRLMKHDPAKVLVSSSRGQQKQQNSSSSSEVALAYWTLGGYKEDHYSGGNLDDTLDKIGHMRTVWNDTGIAVLTAWAFTSIYRPQVWTPRHVWRLWFPHLPVLLNGHDDHEGHLQVTGYKLLQNLLQQTPTNSLPSPKFQHPNDPTETFAYLCQRMMVTGTKEINDDYPDDNEYNDDDRKDDQRLPDAPKAFGLMKSLLSKYTVKHQVVLVQKLVRDCPHDGLRPKILDLLRAFVEWPVPEEHLENVTINSKTRSTPPAETTTTTKAGKKGDKRSTSPPRNKGDKKRSTSPPRNKGDNKKRSTSPPPPGAPAKGITAPAPLPDEVVAVRNVFAYLDTHLVDLRSSFHPTDNDKTTTTTIHDAEGFVQRSELYCACLGLIELWLRMKKKTNDDDKPQPSPPPIENLLPRLQDILALLKQNLQNWDGKSNDGGSNSGGGCCNDTNCGAGRPPKDVHRLNILETSLQTVVQLLSLSKQEKDATMTTTTTTAATSM